MFTRCVHNMEDFMVSSVTRAAEDSAWDKINLWAEGLRSVDNGRYRVNINWRQGCRDTVIHQDIKQIHLLFHMVEST